MRSIVTSQPDVACDVCGRRLLRGEHPDVFIAGGQRRMVCELCGSRATHEGWLREADAHSVSARRMRRGGARTLLGRLRQLREREPLTEPSVALEPLRQGSSHLVHDAGLENAGRWSAGAEVGMEERSGESLLAGEPHGQEAAVHTPHWDESASLLEHASTTSGDVKVALALQMFNASEQPRRIAGVARALGMPCVSARAVGDAGSRITIVVAWELCWYRYEVDIGNVATGPLVIAEGTELEELPAEDRLGGVRVDELGELFAELA